MKNNPSTQPLDCRRWQQQRRMNRWQCAITMCSGHECKQVTGLCRAERTDVCTLSIPGPEDIEETKEREKRERKTKQSEIRSEETCQTEQRSGDVTALDHSHMSRWKWAGNVWLVVFLRSSGYSLFHRFYFAYTAWSRQLVLNIPCLISDQDSRF